MTKLGLAGVGANCGPSLEDNDAVVGEFVAAAPGIPLWVKPNAGVSKIVGDAVVYEAGPR